MHWSTFVSDMARAIALVAAINMPVAALLLFLAGRKQVARG
jgi:hypothetical protein